jgi:hypothetical protein
MFEPIDRAATARPYACACWLLTALFAATVLARVWSALPDLPPFEVLRGVLPSWLSLAIQIAILAATALVSWRLQRGLAAPKPLLGQALSWLAVAYLALILGRISSGLTASHAALSSWDLAGAAVHGVLAGFVWTVSLYHRHELPAW